MNVIALFDHCSLSEFSKDTFHKLLRFFLQFLVAKHSETIANIDHVVSVRSKRDSNTDI